MQAWRLIATRLLAACCAAVAAQASGAAAGWKPERPVEIVVPGGPGGGIDIQARTVQRILQTQRIVETPLVVVNRPGGSATVGLTYLAQQAADGYHIGMGSSALLTNHITGKSTLHYTDFTLMPQLATESIAFCVRSESDLKDGRGFLDRMRKDPAAARVGLPSVASSNHIASALLVKAVGSDPTKLRTVIFNSSAQGITALLGGHIDVVAAPALNAIPHMKRGAMRVLLVTAPKRLQGDLASVPTARELGADVVVGAYRSVIGPKGMAADKVAFWDDAFARMVATPEWKEFMRSNAWEDNFLASRDSAAFVRARYEAFRAALADLGLAKPAP